MSEEWRNECDRNSGKPSIPIPDPNTLTTQGEEPFPKTERIEDRVDLVAGTRLDTPKFREAWGKWELHVLARTGKRLNDIVQQAQLAALSRLGVDKAVRDVMFSIEKNAGTILDSENDFQRPRSNGKVQQHLLPGDHQVVKSFKPGERYIP